MWALTTDGPRPTRWEHGWRSGWKTTQKIKLRPSTYKTSQGFLKNHIKPQIGGIPLADLTSLDLQRFYKHLLDGGRVDRIEAKKETEGTGSENRAKHPSDDRLGVQPRYRAALRHEESNAGLCLAEGGAQGDEDPDRRPTQRLLPRGQRQRRVRTLLPRPRHRAAAGRTAGFEVEGR